MKKVIGIGKQSFEDIIQSNCFYIDKTSLIKRTGIHLHGKKRGGNQKTISR